MSCYFNFFLSFSIIELASKEILKDIHNYISCKIYNNSIHIQNHESEIQGLLGLVQRYPVLRQERLDYHYPILDACRILGGNEEKIAQFIRAGVPIDQSDSCGHTSLMMEVSLDLESNSCEYVRYLLEQKASVVLKDSRGTDALMRALSSPKSLPVAHILLDTPSVKNVINDPCMPHQLSEIIPDEALGSSYAYLLKIYEKVPFRLPSAHSYLYEALSQSSFHLSFKPSTDNKDNKLETRNAYESVISKILAVGARVGVAELTQAVKSPYDISLFLANSSLEDVKQFCDICVDEKYKQRVDLMRAIANAAASVKESLDPHLPTVITQMINRYAALPTL